MMQKGQNFNHPEKGKRTKVQPIMELRDIETIKKLLADKPLDYALFVVGINTAFRASDLLSIRVWQVKNLKVNDSIDPIEKKTKKERRVTINKTALEAIQELLNSKAYDDTDFLFKGQRGPITVPGLHAKVKSWCKMINLKGNYGSHTLRKTWGFIQRVIFKVPLPILMECFGHATQRQTMAYLCIQPEEIKNVYKNEL